MIGSPCISIYSNKTIIAKSPSSIEPSAHTKAHRLADIPVPEEHASALPSGVSSREMINLGALKIRSLVNIMV